MSINDLSEMGYFFPLLQIIQNWAHWKFFGPSVKTSKNNTFFVFEHLIWKVKS